VFDLYFSAPLIDMVTLNRIKTVIQAGTPFFILLRPNGGLANLLISI